MLIGCNLSNPVFVIGTGVPALEITHWIKQEYPGLQIQNIDHNQYKKLPNGSQCVIGFANPVHRKNLINDVEHLQHNWLTFIHPTSLVENIDNIGPGSMIEPGVIIMYAVSIGKYAWITPRVLICHNATIGNNVIINPGALIAGSTVIGDNVLIGQSSSIKDQLTITSNVEFCMNSVVTKNISEPGQYYGNRRVK
jgi:UDP-3-O-[3-hydroxymyristoyl] glucosamine N-acyltransferase